MTSIFLGFGNFVGIFFGSFAIGAFIGCFSALVFKHTKLNETPMLESGLFIVFAYSSYLFAQGVHASGIVAMLFCGIFMAHYTFDNLSTKSQNTTKYVFQLLSFLSENFIFIYLGITLFTKEGYSFKPVFIFFTFVSLLFFFIFALLPSHLSHHTLCSQQVSILVARFLNVYPLSFLINMFTKKQEEKVTPRMQFMMWWAGESDLFLRPFFFFCARVLTCPFFLLWCIKVFAGLSPLPFPCRLTGLPDPLLSPPPS